MEARYHRQREEERRMENNFVNQFEKTTRGQGDLA
jgi:hypothetical protein